MAITALPTTPLRTQTQTEFNANMAAWLSALPTWTTEVTALGVQVSTNAADALAGAAASSIWVSGAAYITGNVRWSPINYANYRRKTTSSAGVTDPSVDTTNWAPVVSLAGLTLTGTSTLDVIVGTSTTDATSSTAAGTKFASGLAVAKAAYIGGITNLMGGGNISGGTSANDIWYDASTSGLQLKAKTGVTNDFRILNAASQLLVRNPTGTQNMSFGGNIVAEAQTVAKGYTVATLPAGVIGGGVYVTDALTPTYGATVAAGGAVFTKVTYNGSAWKCM
jgi:hypothetical protein